MTDSLSKSSLRKSAQIEDNSSLKGSSKSPTLNRRSELKREKEKKKQEKREKAVKDKKEKRLSKGRKSKVRSPLTPQIL